MAEGLRQAYREYYRTADADRSPQASGGHCYADLYQLHFWHDFDHLNADGAALFSRQLAVELARLLDLPCAFVTEADFPQPQTCRIIPER